MDLADQLALRRQFILTPELSIPYEGLNQNQVGDLYLYSHQELNVQQAANEDWQVTLVGDLYDYQEPEKSNQEIVENVAANVKTREDLLSAFDPYCGSFFVLASARKNNQLMALTDMAGSREFFYHLSEKGMLAASQPKTLANIAKLPPREDVEFKTFLESRQFKSRQTLVGTETEFPNAYRLKPNHLLDLRTGQVKRYFPTQGHGKGELKPTAQKAAAMIKGFVEAIHRRGKLAIPVSAGWESRVLLAASKNISKEMAYFVFQHGNYSPNHQDVKVPRNLLKKLGLNLNIITYETRLEDALKKKISDQLSFPRMNNFAFLINGLHKQLPGYAILNGNISEVARLQYDEIDVRGGAEAANLVRYHGQPYAIKQLQTWHDESKQAFDQNGYLFPDMLYWEEASANWVAKTNTETRLITEITQPFNCKQLITMMMRVEKRYRYRQTARLYREIVQELWPECLAEPVNPSLKKTVIRLLQTLGIYTKYRNLLMQFQIRKIPKN